MTYHLAQMIELISVAEFMEAQLTFGEWVIDQVESAGMQQKEFAALVGVDPSTVSKWKKNENLPRGTTCDQIAAVLHLDRNEVRARAGRTQVNVTRAVTWNVEAQASQGQRTSVDDDRAIVYTHVQNDPDLTDHEKRIILHALDEARRRRREIEALERERGGSG